MNGASDAEKATTVINCLDATCVELVMPHLSSDCWSYLEAREAIIADFRSKAFIASKKDTFMRIEFKDNETINRIDKSFLTQVTCLNVVFKA